jgi:hypothetical protein
MRDDLILGTAMVFTVGFALAVFGGYNSAAAWFAGGLALVGTVKIVLVISDALSPDH